MAGVSGLIYSECFTVAKMMGMEVEPHHFQGLQVLEGEYLRVQAQRHQ